MRKSLAVAILFMAPAIFAQSRTSVFSLGAGMYSVTSSSGSQIVNVVPLGNGMYSFFSSSGTTATVTLAPGTYSFTNGGGLVATANVAYVAPGQYYFYILPSTQSRGVTGINDPIPNYTVKPPDTTGEAIKMAQLQLIQQQQRALEYQMAESCNTSGRVWYKAHWYSNAQCVTPGQVAAMQTKKKP